MRGRRFAGAGLMRRGGREPGGASMSAGGGPSLSALGADLLHWWEVPVSSSPLITLNGGNVSQLNDRVSSGAAHMVQATAINQPLYEATGGPRGEPCTSAQDVARFMEATFAIGAGNRAGVYAVYQQAAVASRTTINSTPVGIFRNVNDTTGYLTFTGGPQNSVKNGVDANWHLHSLLPFATGAHAQHDGINVDTDFTGSDTVVAYTQLFWFHNGTAGGKLACVIIVQDITAAKDAIVKQYVRARYGLTIA